MHNRTIDSTFPLLRKEFGYQCCYYYFTLHGLIEAILLKKNVTHSLV